MAVDVISIWLSSKQRDPSLVRYVFVTRTEGVIYKVRRRTTPLQIIRLWVLARSNRVKPV